MEFEVNGRRYTYEGDPSLRLLQYLRLELGLVAPKDGCSGQAACGACLVEVNGQAALACATPMSTLGGKTILTVEGFPPALRQTLAQAFLNRGAIQCGFCTPGFLTRAKILLQGNPSPTREDVVRAVRPHLCRCTGYIPLVDAILDAAQALGEQREPLPDLRPGIGSSWPKYGGLERALGQRPFVDDLTNRHWPDMLHGALVFSRYPRARILALYVDEALALPGVQRVLTAEDIPGRSVTGMHVKDWPLFISPGETTRYIGDVLACVVADTEARAREGAAAVRVEYEELPGLFTAEEALAQSRIAEEQAPEAALLVEPAAGTNTLLDKTIRRGPTASSADFAIDDLLGACAHTAQGTFTTPLVEHAFLETEACVAVPVTAAGADNLPGLRVYDQAQGIWHDREDIAAVLGIGADRVEVLLMDAGGGFGGKEDISVQAHAALAAWVLQKPVKLRLTRPQSLRMHPKRHAMRLDYTLGCDAAGKLQAAKVRILADAGAYASVSGAVVTRTGTHATGAYEVPYVDVQVQAVYTNNIPAGAFRGFGVNQSNFAMESMIDELCAQAGFDPWQFRYDNAVGPGSMITTGQMLGEGVALRETLLAVKDAYATHPRAGLACAVKNAGIGNGMAEPCDCVLTITDAGGIRIDHGWTEMGQGIHTVARQLLCQRLGLDASVPVEVVSSTVGGAYAGSTTASRGTFQLGHALLAAADALAAALVLPVYAPGEMPGEDALHPDLLRLFAGRRFQGHYDSLGQTSAGLPPGEVRNHVSYSFATHVAFLDENGRVEKILAAHDSGTVINKALYDSQVYGGVAMSLGYALTEELALDQGQLRSDSLRACGLPRAEDMPEVEVIAVEKLDPEGPMGAKGLGEISAIPGTAAIINALTRFTGRRCYDLPLHKGKGTRSSSGRGDS